MFTPTSEAAFGEGGILLLRFRKTRRHIAVLTLEQMCCLFYLKRAAVSLAATLITPSLELSVELSSNEGVINVFRLNSDVLTQLCFSCCHMTSSPVRRRILYFRVYNVLLQYINTDTNSLVQVLSFSASYFPACTAFKQHQAVYH